MKQQPSSSRRAHILGFFPALVLAVGLAAPLAGCGYNDVITLDESVKANFAEVENQYKRPG